MPTATITTPELKLNGLAVPSRFWLAPLAGYTNLAFRLAVREIGGLGLATSDLVNARGLLRESRKSLELVQTCPEDRPVAVQLYGADATEMCDAAQWLQAYGVSAVDINMGCPVHKVVRGGGGSALMCETDRAVRLVQAVVEAVRIPVTVKMRLGWDDQTLSAPHFARAFEEIGVAAITIHGRTREQGFAGSVRRDGIRAVVEAVERIPIIGNGDVRSIADAQRMLEETGCAGIAIGRGALLNPWIFLQLQRWEECGDPGPGATYLERLDFMHRHFHLQVVFRGERFGCLTFRKVANWYSRVLKPGRELHQRLMRVSSAEQFDAIYEELRDRAIRDGRAAESCDELPFAVPQGPIEHW